MIGQLDTGRSLLRNEVSYNNFIRSEVKAMWLKGTVENVNMF